MVKWIIAAILLLPVAEIAAFVVVASLIGAGWALLLMLATSFCGFVVLRQVGRGGLAQFRVAVGDPNSGGLQANAGALLTVLGGFLLLLPGFITDTIGALMLLAPVRRWCGVTFRRAAGVPRRNAADGVIDLAPEEWRQVPERELDRPRDRPDRG